jgi:hypothetical protein
MDEDVEKRFGCAECGSIFCMECEEDMIPKFCPFCANPVYCRDDEEEEFCDDDEVE